MSSVFISWAARVPAEWFTFPHVQSFVHMIPFNSPFLFALLLYFFENTLTRRPACTRAHALGGNSSAQAHVSDCVSWVNSKGKVYTPLPSPACRHCYSWLTPLSRLSDVSRTASCYTCIIQLFTYRYFSSVPQWRVISNSLQYVLHGQKYVDTWPRLLNIPFQMLL